MLTISSSLLLYILTYSTAALLMYIYEKKESIISFFVAILIPSILAYLRFYVGTDYRNYYSFFSNLKKMNMFEIIKMESDIEVGFRIISKILLYIGNNEQFVFGAIAFLGSLIYIYAYFKLVGKNNISLFYFIYLMSTFTGDFNGVRQGLAMSIVFYSMHYFYDDKISQYILIIVLAATIHLSSLIIFIILLPKIKHLIKVLKKKPIYIPFLFLLIVIVTGVFQGNLYMLGFNKFENYIKKGTPGGRITIIINVIEGIILISIGTYFNKNKQTKKVLSLIPFYILTNMTGLISVHFLRFNAVFSWVPQILISNLSLIVREKMFIKYTVIIIYIIRFILIYGMLGHSDVVPFRLR